VDWQRRFEEPESEALGGGLPAGLLVLKAMTVPNDPPDSGSTVEWRATAPALVTLDALGPDRQLYETLGVTADIQRALETVTVPVMVRTTDEVSAISLHSDGAAVATSLLQALTPLVDRNPVPSTASTAEFDFTLRDLGSRPAIRPPPADQVMPTNAPDGYTCPANG
jgi:hypothetical protein